MKIEKDQVRITSGVRHGKTLGSPITMIVENRDWKNWQKVMSVEAVEEKAEKLRRVSKPRPGHADLVGGMKYHHSDLRNVLERSSARETTMRVAVGALSKQILAAVDIDIASHVVILGGLEASVPENLSVNEIKEKTSVSEVNMVDGMIEEDVKNLIDQTKKSRRYHRRSRRGADRQCASWARQLCPMGPQTGWENCSNYDEHQCL
jgi:chorismate synthase